MWKSIRTDIYNNLKIDKDKVSLACLQALIVCFRNEFMDCPTAWEGQFQDEDSNMSIILKNFFGLIGSNNDINSLNKFSWLQSCWEVKLMAWDQRSMVTHIQDIIYLQIESTLVGLVLFIPYTKLKMKRGTFYKNVKGLKTCHVKKCFCIVQIWFNMIHNQIRDFDIVLTNMYTPMWYYTTWNLEMNLITT